MDTQETRFLRLVEEGVSSPGMLQFLLSYYDRVLLLSSPMVGRISGNLVPAHADPRRTIYEFSSVDDGFSMVCIQIHAPIPVGNHIHLKKTEHFCLFSGRGFYSSAPYDPVDMRFTDRLVTRRIDAGEYIIVPPYMGHAFVLEPESWLSYFSNKAFDPNDHDSIVCPVIRPQDLEGLR